MANPVRSFRLFRGGRSVTLVPEAPDRWRVLVDSPSTGFRSGDLVTSVRKLTWEEARRRVNSDRSAASPNSLVLLSGSGSDRSASQVEELLRSRPWDPEGPRAA
jgi:hypothetical protein